MRSVSLNRITHNGKTLILAYDQGFEQGPIDFNEKNIDPAYIFNIAAEGRYNALAVHSGLAEKFYTNNYKDIPLIVKLNGKTRYNNQEPLSLQHTSVSYASKLGAAAVGYTIYLGSTQEAQMLKEFGAINEAAHEIGLPSVLWMYPRGPEIKNDTSTEILAYAARLAQELGADIVKVKSNSDISAMKWVIKAAGKTKVVIAGGSRATEQEFLDMVHNSMESGAIGLAVGRNVWQHEKPLEMTKAIKEIIFKNASTEKSLGFFKK